MESLVDTYKRNVSLGKIQREKAQEELLTRFDALRISVEKKRRKDYYIFKENNQKEEKLYGKKVKGSWEFLPHGKFIMFYSEKKDIYVPARITQLTKQNLLITTFDLKINKLITLVYDSN